MKLIDGCHSLKLECALRDLGFVDIGWKCVAHAGIFFVQPVGIPNDPEGDLLGFNITVPYAKDYKKIKMLQTARKALDFAQGIDQIQYSNLKIYMIFLSNPQVWTLSGTWSDRALSASGLTNMELMMTLDTILLPLICVVGIFALSTKKRKRV